MDGKNKGLEHRADVLRREGCGDKEIFQFLLIEFCGTPYVWGGCSTEGSDCSGTVCSVLNAVFRTRIRITADMLYRRCFTRAASGELGIQALFFIDRRTGRVIHVSGYMGNGEYLNESRREPKKCGTMRTLEEFRRMYADLELEQRMLDRGAWR